MRWIGRYYQKWYNHHETSSSSSSSSIVFQRPRFLLKCQNKIGILRGYYPGSSIIPPSSWVDRRHSAIATTYCNCSAYTKQIAGEIAGFKFLMDSSTVEWHEKKCTTRIKFNMHHSLSGYRESCVLRFPTWYFERSICCAFLPVAALEHKSSFDLLQHGVAGGG